MSPADLELPTVQHNLSLPSLQNRDSDADPLPPRSRAVKSADLLHPRSIGGVLDLAFDLYRQHFWPLLTVFAVVFIPVQAILYLLTDCWYRPLSVFVEANPEDTYSGLVQGCGALLLGAPQSGVPGIISFLTLAVASAPLAAAVGDIFRGNTPVWQECYRRVFSRIPALLTWWIIMGLCYCTILMLSFVFDLIVATIMVWFAKNNPELIGTIVALVALITPYLLSMTLTACLFTFTSPLIVLENLPLMEVPARNWQLVGTKRAGRTWIAVVALPLVFLVVQVTISLSIGMLLSLLRMPPLLLFFAQHAFQITLQLFLQPYVLIFLNVLYFDARFQRDALDIHMLAQRLPALRLPGQFAEQSAPVYNVATAQGWMPAARVVPSPLPTGSMPVPSVSPVPVSGSLLPDWYNHSAPPPTIDPAIDTTEVVP